jgi:simple sugar transport system permease protein
MQIPSALTGVFEGVLLVTMLACDTFIQHRVRWGNGAPAGAARADPTP